LHDSERSLADATGGQAFYGSNDVRDAMRRAFDDGRFAYAIGFYPNHGKWDGKYHKIKIQTRSTGGNCDIAPATIPSLEKLRVTKRRRNRLQQAVLSLLDATGLSMIVTGKPAGAAGDRKFEFHVALDPKQLLLKSAENHRNGGGTYILCRRDAKEQTVAADNQRVALNLEEKQYQYLEKSGPVLARHLTILPQATEVRVLCGMQALRRSDR
jgi:hypothetical protein